MFVQSDSANPAIHALSIRLARECRHVIQACLREDEWGLCDREFYTIIRQGLEELAEKEVRHAAQ